MTSKTRHERLFQTFATLADTLVAEYDVVELLQTLVDSCQELLDVSGAGILIADSSGQLELIASTSEEARLVEVIQLSAEAGPCVECFVTSKVVSVADLSVPRPGWAEFRRAATDSGFAAVDAIPMRLRDTTIGTLNLFRTVSGAAAESDLAAARAFADVATIGILHERVVSDTRSLAEQLRSALDSRVVIEQAKGVVSFTARVPVDQAFLLIRTYARTRGLRLGDVAARIVRRDLRIGAPGT